MKQTKEILLILLVSFSLNVSGQLQNTAFNKIYHLVEQKNFFKASEIYEAQKNELTTVHRQIIEVILDNAFNRLEISNKNITRLTRSKNNLPDSLMLKLYKTKEDNAVKLFDYRAAKNAVTTILADYKKLLSDNDRNEIENNLKIWTVLEREPKQQVKIKEFNRLKMEKDKAGLNNLKVSGDKNTVDFIFDTGANLSTTSETAARQLNMKIIPADIKVGTITGETVFAQLAVCPIMTLGNIEIRNAVFLVLKDDVLAFPQIDYKINGILGFPVIEALKEIQTTPDGYFIVPKKETKYEAKSNMAMDGLTPLILLNDKHFALDTGADHTILYSSYYSENRQEIESNRTQTTIAFGGAAGAKEFKGYKIDISFNVNDKNVTLKNVSVLTHSLEEKENGIYGNIGQDFIRRFDKMTLNFNRMFIKFN